MRGERLESLPHRQAKQAGSQLLHLAQHIQLVNRPVGSLGFTRLLDADEPCLRRFRQQVLRIPRLALALQHRLAPLLAIHGQRDFIATRVVAAGLAGIQHQSCTFEFFFFVTL